MNIQNLWGMGPSPRAILFPLQSWSKTSEHVVHTRGHTNRTQTLEKGFGLPGNHRNLKAQNHAVPVKMVKASSNCKTKIWQGFGESCILILTSISAILLESNMEKCNESWCSTSSGLHNICLRPYSGKITQKKNMMGVRGCTGKRRKVSKNV